jgi:tellurite resistance protein TehA-like permease
MSVYSGVVVSIPNFLLQVGWRRIVRNFSPSWFAVTMGTGIVSLLFISIPFKARWLYWLSVIFFCLNALLYFAFLLISILRYTLYPESM